jgi:hypothetical protein
VRKIPTLYARDESRRFVTDEVTPGCEWVLAGEGVPTRKYDGTCVMLDEDGQWWARREVKRDKVEPVGFVEVNFDRVTGKRMGWEPIIQSSFSKCWSEAMGWQEEWEPGTYELLGPKINGNPERYAGHILVRHADAQTVEDMLLDKTRIALTSPKAMVAYLATVADWEGLVWHHPDGRMVKLKARDLGPEDRGTW